ncbi:hypothetical protein QZH41_008903, partial [Actinostola sp. cb2023]
MQLHLRLYNSLSGFRIPGLTDLHLDEAATQPHEFSIPWKNSDTVLIIEGQNLHVHRVILEMASPVFQTMFSQRAEDAQGNEISFPGKKVVEFVDFLRHIYPQFSSKLTTHNVGYIYALAKEFNVEIVLEACTSYHYAAVTNLSVKELKNLEFLEDLDAKILRDILLPRAERLEECIVEVVPQLLGIIDCAVYLTSRISNEEMSEAKYRTMRGKPTLCPLHYDINSKRAKRCVDGSKERLTCKVCMLMLADLKSNSYIDASNCYYTTGNFKFDENIAKVLQDMSELVT